MNANNILSYMKSKPVRVKVFVPFEFWALGPTAAGLIIATLVFLVSAFWGTWLYIITAICFLLANMVRNVEAGQVMIVIKFNRPSKNVRSLGIHVVFPFISLCNFYTINFVREEKEMRNLETQGDGYRLGYAYVLKTKINRNLVYLYEDDILRGKENEVMQALNDALLEASKNEVKRYSHEDLVERNTDLQEDLKAAIETNFLALFGESLNLLCGHDDLYTVDLTIVNLIFDEAYMSKLKEKNQAKMDAEIAAFDKQATITDAEAKAKATEIEGAAKAKAIELEGEALRKNPDVIRHRMAEHSNIQVLSGDGARTIVGGDKPQIIVP